MLYPRAFNFRPSKIVIEQSRAIRHNALVRWILTISCITIVLLATAGFLLTRTRPTHTPTTAPISAAATAPSRFPSARPDVFAPVVVTFPDLLRLLPGMADARIADAPLSLNQAARIKIPYHCYICPRGDLWISHPQAPSAADLLAELAKDQTHLCREQVVFAHWPGGLAARPAIVIRDPRGAFQLLRKDRPPVKLNRFDYLWNAAMTMENSLVIPCEQGVAVVSIDAAVQQSYRQLTNTSGPTPQVAVTGRGFVAWIPSVRPDQYAGAVARFIDGKWIDGFAAGDWAGPFVHLIPFADGSVLQLRPAAEGRVTLSIVTLEANMNAGNPVRIRELVTQLADDSADLRNNAHAQLVTMGPAAWNALDALLPSALPEAQIRIQEILKNRQSPQLGRFRTADDRVRVIWRLLDGGIVLLAEGGVILDPTDPEKSLLSPAWLVVRPGRPFEILPRALTRNLAIGSIDVSAINGEWFVAEPAEGARILFGQELLALTDKSNARYRQPVGVDRRGRILLAPMDGQKFGHDYLLIDPYIADPTPTLSIWTMTIDKGEVGWDLANWPAVKSGQPWLLMPDYWTPLKGELLSAGKTPITRTTPDATFTQIAGLPNGSTIWSSPAFLELQKPNGPIIRQPWPEKVPTDVVAAVAGNNFLLLLHPNGAISRLKVDVEKPAPFTLTALFTTDVPAITSVRRMWIDPSGRVCIATPDGRLVIIFTDQKIPPAMLDLIPASELKHSRPAQ